MRNSLNWAVLTDANVWQCYAVTRGEPVNYDLIFEVRLTDTAQPVDEKVNLLYMLSQEGLWQVAVEGFWEQQQAVSPINVLRALLAESTVNLLRRELRALTGYRAETERLREVLIHQVVRGDVYQQLLEKQPSLARTGKGKVKTRQAQPLSAKCFAYTPDPDDPSTWKLP
ncbi:MAG: hypothetical protein HY320_10000 [Armatimonadetes bacterium]|nr:hypothetical protein [Armatimonadota bacterium]